jgi:hypothetical protein
MINKLFQFDIQNHILSKTDEMEAVTIYKELVSFEKGNKKNKKLKMTMN